MIENLRLRPLSTPYGVASSNSETFEKTLDGEAPIFIEISKDSDSDIYRFCQFLYIRIVFSPFYYQLHYFQYCYRRAKYSFNNHVSSVSGTSSPAMICCCNTKISCAAFFPASTPG